MQHAGVDVPLLMQEAPSSPQQATVVLISKHLCKGISAGQDQGVWAAQPEKRELALEQHHGLQDLSPLCMQLDGKNTLSRLAAENKQTSGISIMSKWCQGRACTVLPAAQDSNAALTQSF